MAMKATASPIRLDDAQDDNQHMRKFKALRSWQRRSITSAMLFER